MDGHILTSNNISSPVYTIIINEQMFQQYNNPMVVYYIMFYIQIQTEATNDNLALCLQRQKKNGGGRLLLTQILPHTGRIRS